MFRNPINIKIVKGSFINVLFLSALIPYSTYGQDTLSNQLSTVSLGGGFSTSGSFQNFVVVGELMSGNEATNDSIKLISGLLLSVENPDLCPVPLNVSVDSLSQSSVSISWNSTFTGSYEVRYKVKGSQGANSLTTENTSAIITGLFPGTTYRVRVRSVCLSESNPVSDFSEHIDFTTPGNPVCTTPEDIVLIATESESAMITWLPNDDIGQYKYRYRVKGAQSWISGQASDTVNLSGLYPGTTYQFTIRSICAEDGSLVSEYSDRIEFSTLGEPACSAPENINISMVTDSSATINWTSIDQAFEYDLQYKIKGSVGWTSQYVNDNSYSLYNILSGMPYLVRIRALCTEDGSLVSQFSSNIEFLTSGDPFCEIPTDLVETGITDSSANLSWSEVLRATSYDIRYKIADEADWNTVSTSANQIGIQNLLPNQLYYWRVRSVCSIDKSIRSRFSKRSDFSTISFEEGTSANLTLKERDKEFDLKAYPNPFADHLNIEILLPKKGKVTIKIWNVSGKELLTLFDGISNEGVTHYSLDLSHLPKGVYIVNAIGPDGEYYSESTILK